MKEQTIHLGFEVGTGAPIAVPLRHMAVTGQTQRSGKTTTLEALITRSGSTALTFLTKRGEKSFETGRRIQPYFRDRADWQFVDALLEATLGEKNKMLRAPIIKICANTSTLAEVRDNVREALLTARGFYEGAFTQLDAYLELVVPEIERADLADTLDLRPGINVMDVTEFRTEMQMLFIQSALDWVNANCSNTTVVIPEAWEFVPEGKGSPVKASAVSLVRKGAVLGNHIWLDSQDMAGVDKTILRGCTVWLMGVQREANEIKRNLSNIPANLKRPKPEDIAGLERGQFFACFDKTTVKVYVQPAWMAPELAQQFASGEVGVQEIYSDAAPVSEAHKQEEHEVDRATANALTAENERLKSEVEEAERRGFERGLAQSTSTMANAAVAIERFAKNLISSISMSGDSVPLAPTSTDLPTAAAQPKSPTADRRKPAPPPATPGAVSSHAVKLLAVLVRSNPVPLTADLWGAFAEMAPSGGSWNMKVKQLRDAGFVTVEGEQYSATDAGVQASGADAGDAKNMAAVYSLWGETIRGLLGSVAVSILDKLVTAHPKSLSLDQWGLLTKRATSGGSWNSAVSGLKSWGCITADGRYAATEFGLAVSQVVPASERDLAKTLKYVRTEGLSSSARKLFENWSEGCTRADLAERAGVKMTGGSWNSSIKEFVVDSGLVDERGGQIFAKREDLV